MTQLTTEDLLQLVDSTIEELEIALRALDSISENTGEGFQEINQALQEIRDWVDRRGVLLSANRSQLVNDALIAELQEFHNRVREYKSQNFIQAVLKRFQKFFQGSA